MGASAGWPSTIKVSGTSTAMVGEATTNIGADPDGRARRQITNAAKRILDPATTLTVKDGGVAVADADVYAIDFQFGIVTFRLGYVVGGAVTVDGSYLPVGTVTDVRTVSISLERTSIDTTTHDSAVASGGGRRNSLGPLGVELLLELYDGEDPDLDPGAGTAVLQTLMTSDTPKLLEVQYQAGYYFRCWVRFAGINREVDPESLLKKTHKLVGCAQPGTGYSQNAYCSFGQ